VSFPADVLLRVADVGGAYAHGYVLTKLLKPYILSSFFLFKSGIVTSECVLKLVIVIFLQPNVHRLPLASPVGVGAAVQFAQLQTGPLHGSIHIGDQFRKVFHIFYTYELTQVRTPMLKTSQTPNKEIKNPLYKITQIQTSATSNFS
jgi:hypothetical protein